MTKYFEKLVVTSKETLTGIIPAWGEKYDFANNESELITLGIKIGWKSHKNMDFSIKSFIFIKVNYRLYT